MRLRNLLIALAIVAVSGASFAQSAYAATTSQKHASSIYPTIGHACPGKPGSTVSDTKGCGGSGIHPLTSCSGSSCDDVDPYAGNCTGSISTIVTSSVFSSNNHTWITQLRYSNTCQTVWARLLQYDGGHGASLDSDVVEGRLGVYGYPGYPGQTAGDIEYLTGVYDGAYTNMWFVGVHGTAVPPAFASFAISRTATNASDRVNCQYDG